MLTLDEAPEVAEEQAQPTAPTTTKSGRRTMVQRRDLRERYGLIPCSTPTYYLDRLPEESQQPVQGQTEPALRPIAEFSKGIAACKECCKIRTKDRRLERVAAKQAVVHTEDAEEQTATEE